MRVRLAQKLLVGGILWLASVTTVAAAPKVAAPMFDHAVLQRDRPVPIRGWADKGEKITVRFAEQTKTTTADGAGNWSVQLDALQAGGPWKLTIQGATTLTIQDVLVGEVWLCSGQSNMAMPVGWLPNAAAESAAANYPQIRSFHVHNRTAPTPQVACDGRWEVCSPQTVRNFSAAAYFFGRKLYQELKVPIGLINASWGGTLIQGWTSEADQKQNPELQPAVANLLRAVAEYTPQKAQERLEKDRIAWREAVARAKAANRPLPGEPRLQEDPNLTPNTPGRMFNSMIAPLAPYALRGAIWYQGEANTGFVSELYGLQLQTMIRNWRTLWGEGDFPFLCVQLPNIDRPQSQPSEPNGWVNVREGVLQTVRKLPQVGMAVTIDLGEEKNIHPANKQDVGLRLALVALRETYQEPIVCYGPLYKSMEVTDGKIVLKFDCQESKPAVRGGGKLEGFAIAGADQKFVWADAVIDRTRVIVSSPTVPAPVAVRYGWAINPRGNLVNSAGLRASPFRTDNWAH